MILRYSHDSRFPECLLSDTAQALSKLGQELQKLTDMRFYKARELAVDEIYGSVLEGIRFAIDDNNSNKIALNLVDNTFVISGNKTAIRDLGQGLINIFDSDAKAGTHIHYDYLDGHGLTQKTNISLVISCTEN